MNSRQKKNLLVLTAILAVLVAALGVVTAVKRHKAAQPAADASSSAGIIAETGLKLSALSYDNGTASLSFQKDDSGAWVWDGDPDFPLEQSYLTKLVNTLSTLKPQQTITDGDPLEDYGLDTPAMALTATAEDGSSLTYSLGNQVAGGSGSYYLLMNGDEATIYVVDSALHDELALGIYSMMKLPELPVLTQAQISSIRITGKQDTLLTASAGKSEPAADSSAQTETTVTWTCGGTDVTSNETAQSLISSVAALSLNDCQDYQPSDQAVSLCGFGAPQAVLSIAYTDNDDQAQTLTLTVGSATTDGQSLYVRLEGDSTIYSMTAQALSSVLAVATGGLPQ